jgi:G6PDH family F420-dependent oxidoreductase
MAQIGYALSSEEHGPKDLVRYAQRAEEVGFSFALISDHFHPWVGQQGHSPFVWSVIGAIAQATDRLKLGTGVTCPTMRTHPAIIAHAAATCALMMNGRFFLGVGTGENLNEHITGERWPPHDIRIAMLEEAIEIIRALWTGETINLWGDFYTVEDARLFSVPAAPPPLMIAASGPEAARLAGRAGDGLISTAPDAELIGAFEAAGSNGAKPRYGQVTVCWAESEQEAIHTAHKVWPNSGLPGELSQELRTVTHFEQAVRTVKESDVAEQVICGPDPQRHIAAVQEFIDAGFDHVYIHQVGRDQEGFFRFYQSRVLPSLRS